MEESKNYILTAEEYILKHLSVDKNIINIFIDHYNTKK